MIIAEYDAFFGQWERKDFYNYLSNYSNTFSPPWTRSKPLFSKLEILSLHSLYKFHVSCFVFSHFNRLLPASLSSLLHFNRDFHDYLTRSRFNLHKMSLKYQFAICSQAPTIWNDIPLTVRDSLTTINFKKKLKLHFLILNWTSAPLSQFIVSLFVTNSVSVIGLLACKLI